jgi:hypothetical protein
LAKLLEDEIEDSSEQRKPISIDSDEVQIVKSAPKAETLKNIFSERKPLTKAFDYSS